MMGQPVGLRVEFAVAELPILKHHRNRIGCSGDLLLKQLMNALFARIGPVRLIEPHQQLLALCWRQEVQSADALLIIGHHGFEQAEQVRAHALDAGAIEQIAGVRQRSRDALPAVPER